MLNEPIMEDWVSLLAVVVKAMTGALHRARSPPMELNAVRKLARLQMQSNITFQFNTQFHNYYLGIQWASSITMITRCFFMCEEAKILCH